jgi:hypothetical protein
MCRFDLAVGHAAFATADTPKLARGGQTSLGPFHDQLTLHLGEAGHDVEEEAAGGCLGVDTVCQAAEVHFARLKGGHEIHEPLYAPTQAIQLPNDQRVSGSQVRQCINEARANQPGAAHFVREYSLAAGLFERIELER